MAFYLDFLDSNDYVSIPALPVMSNFDITIEFVNTGNVQTIIGSDTPTSTEDNNEHFRLGVSSTGKVLVLNGTETIESSTSVNLGDVRTVTYSVRNHSGGFSGTAELFLEGVKEGVTTSFRGACLANSTITMVGRSVSSDQGARNFIGGELRRLQVIDYDNPVNSRDYNKQTLNGSNDTVLPDTESGNDGTLINFPTDNSQWVFFDNGGGAVTLDGATTLPSLTATGSASATLPQPDASGSIIFNAPTVAGNATATLPQPTLQAAITLPVVTANGSASATLPGFNLSASVSIPTLTATGAAQATLPQPVVSASVTMPSLTALGTAEATEPSFTVSGNVTLQPPTVTGSVSATLPQPSISGNIALPSIQASGFIIGGEVVITVELETNINEPQLSVNINEPTLSTNITE